MSIIVGVEGRGGRVRAETRTLLDYAGHHYPHEGGPTEAGSLSASNLFLTLTHCDGVPVCLYSVSRCHSAGRGKYFSTLEVPS